MIMHSRHEVSPYNMRFRILGPVALWERVGLSSWLVSWAFHFLEDSVHPDTPDVE